MRNKCIVFLSDNQAVVEIINKQTSKDSSIMVLLRHFVLSTLKYNILFALTAKAGCFISPTGREIQITSTFRRPTTDAGSGGPNTQQLAHHLTELLHSAITKGSRRTYERAWKTYVEFSSEFCDSRRSLLPVSVNNLALFISYLSAKKFASSTISTYVSTLSYVHKLGNFPDPTNFFLVQKLLMAHS